MAAVLSTRPAPATERGRRTRAAIVAAAAELMYERGVTHTSLDDVLAYGGAGKSQLYHYFTNKADLVDAVIEHQLALVIDGQPRLRTLRTWADFDRWAAAFLARHQTTEGPRVCRLGRFAAELDADEALSGRLASAFAVWQEHLAAGLRELQTVGKLDPDADPDALAAGLLAALQGGIMMARLRRDAAPLEQSLTLAMAGLRARSLP